MSYKISSYPNGLALEGLPGRATCTIEGPPALLDALLSPFAAPPEATWGQPLRLHLRVLPGATAVYPLWAFWLSPEIVWEPRFSPMQVWRAQLQQRSSATPLLVIARAQGRWDLQESFSAEFTQLLQERDPLGMPDSRLLIVAPRPVTPMRDTLASALATFLHALSPRSEALLPEATLFIRSGINRIRWNLPVPATLCLHSPRMHNRAREFGSSPLRLSIPHGLSILAEWSGPFLWGAWRTQERQERFLTLGVRGGAALRGGLRVALASGEENRPRFHAASSHHLLASSLSRNASNQVLERAVRAIQRDLLDDFRIQTVLEAPYGELLRLAVSPPLPLTQVIELPEPPPIDPLPGESLEENTAALPPSAEGLLRWLLAPREAQAVLGQGNRPGPTASLRMQVHRSHDPQGQLATGRTNAA